MIDIQDVWQNDEHISTGNSSCEYVWTTSIIDPIVKSRKKLLFHFTFTFWFWQKWIHLTYSLSCIVTMWLLQNNQTLRKKHVSKRVFTQLYWPKNRKLRKKEEQFDTFNHYFVTSNPDTPNFEITFSLSFLAELVKSGVCS